MSRWRIFVVLGLVALPTLLLAGAGSYYLWQTGVGLLLWWPMMACLALGYFLAHHWIRKRQLLHAIDFTPPEVSAERDRLAWQIIENRAKTEGLTEDMLTSLQQYVKTAEELVRELAAHYHPGEKDPAGGLTIPEMLAVVELAARDLAGMVDNYIPGGHLLTIHDFQRARRAVELYQSATQLYWLVSALFAPLNTGLRYTASKFGVAQPVDAIRENLLAWAYTAFVQRLGFYLIELYSGRLRVGTDRWRELVRGDEGTARVVALALVGQVKAGKSSLVNALLGERKAQADILPATNAVQRYHLAPAGIDAQLLIADTQGYGHDGPKADQVEATREAARTADMLLLVLHARNPGRQADVEMLKSLRDWFASKTDLKMPPVLAVLTHVDLLSPAMEWQPPYDWQKGNRSKEQHIREAVKATLEQLGDLVDGVVPVCTTEGNVYGIEEGVLPALAARLDEARVVSVLRCLRGEPDTGKIKKVFGQLLEAGKGLMRVMWQK